jgi:SpoVK/Ycf46/Vps4 family AAA+-type ATPase
MIENHMVMVMFDDVDEQPEDRLTRIMEGTVGHTNVCWLGTTNYVERVSARLKRHGRFDEVIELAESKEQLDLLDWVNSLDIAEEERSWIIEKMPGRTPSEVRELVVRRSIYKEERDLTM